MFDENFDKNNARRVGHVGQTHNNKRPAFGAYSFTIAGMTFLTVTFTNVSFTLRKVTFMGCSGNNAVCPPQQ